MERKRESLPLDLRRIGQVTARQVPIPVASRPATNPTVVVFSSLFPSPAQPNAGIFIRERMFRVAQHLPLIVVAPAPWFPFQSLLRWFKPHFRPDAPRRETQLGVEVRRPRFLSAPGVLKHLDGFFMAIGAFATIRRLRGAGQVDIIDAHFAYPDGYAAVLLGKWLNLPVTITLRGTESRLAADRHFRPLVARALRGATQVFSVSASLRSLAIELGADPGKVEVVGNGVDLARFAPQDRTSARSALGLTPDAPVLVSVGGLVPRKGMQRVIALLPELRKRHPAITYLVVGAGSAEGNTRPALEQQVDQLGLRANVRFLGPKAPDELASILSAADVFVLWTSNEGWANVFLEAMACGLPVVTTDVGGNREVVANADVGTIVAFEDAQGMMAALSDALARTWDRAAIRAYAERNSWDSRVDRLCEHFRRIAAVRSAA